MRRGKWRCLNRHQDGFQHLNPKNRDLADYDVGKFRYDETPLETTRRTSAMSFCKRARLKIRARFWHFLLCAAMHLPKTQTERSTPRRRMKTIWKRSCCSGSLQISRHDQKAVPRAPKSIPSWHTPWISNVSASLDLIIFEPRRIDVSYRKKRQHQSRVRQNGGFYGDWQLLPIHEESEQWRNSLFKGPIVVRAPTAHKARELVKHNVAKQSFRREDTAQSLDATRSSTLQTPQRLGLCRRRSR